MSKTPTIGSYRRPTQSAAAEPEPEIVEKAQRVETPASTLSEGIQEDLRESLSKTRETTDKAKSYEEILADQNISLQKAHAIVDAMLEKGFYEETFPLKLPSASPITVTFRTRLQSDYVRYLRALEVYMPKYAAEQQEIQMRYFLASSLVQYRGTKFKTSNDADKDHSTTLDWIEKQPERLIFLLSQKLSIFDMQVSSVMSEGAVENF